jgi:hypothetical protein
MATVCHDMRELRQLTAMVRTLRCRICAMSWSNVRIGGI